MTDKISILKIYREFSLVFGTESEALIIPLLKGFNWVRKKTKVFNKSSKTIAILPGYFKLK